MLKISQSERRYYIEELLLAKCRNKYARELSIEELEELLEIKKTLRENDNRPQKENYI